MISPIQEPTDWVSSMIAAKKPDGNIRLCIDPHYLKKKDDTKDKNIELERTY